MSNYNDTITEALVNWATRQPDEACRRWSYEIESPQIAQYTDALFDAGFECHQDGSVSTQDCECECGDCCHSCDCDRCDVSDYGFDHCQTCQANEASPSDSQPCDTTKDAERLGAVGRYLDQYYIDSTCGQHVHVNAEDLNARQVANVCRIWDRINDLLGHADIIGRPYHPTFSAEFRNGEIDRVARGETIDRYRSVNPMGILYHLDRISNGYSGYSKSTIEFRQFAGTVDPLLIIARGYLARAIVEWAKKDTPIYWALNAKTAKDLLAEFGIKL